MAIPRNNGSFSFSTLVADAEQWLLERPKAFIDDIKYKLNNLPQTNFDLGCDFAERGQWQDAVFRFRIAIYLQPEFTKAYYNLGCCYLRLNKRLPAKNAFIRALSLQPNHSDALLMLSAIDPSCVAPNQRPTRMPAAVVTDFFDSLAEQYDAIEATNKYNGGKVCFDALKPLIADQEELRIVDLGCGTGLASRAFRSIAANITGIDFAPKIVAAAQQIRIGNTMAFDAVLQEDIVNLSATAANLADADIILCCNAAQFVGDLQPMLRTLSARMKPGALLLFTIEPFNIAAGYGVNIDTGRFGHHPDHVKQLIQTTGFTVKTNIRANLYPSINAQLFVVTKAAA